MKSIITANFNLLKQNSIWDKLKFKDRFIFDEYNNFNFSLNNDSIMKKYNQLYLIIYVNEIINEEKNINNFFSLLNRITKKYSSKKFYIFLLREKLNNFYLDQNNLLKLNSYFNKLNKKPNLFFMEIPESKTKFNLRNYFYIRCPLELTTLGEIIKSINNINNENNFKNYKLLVLDCDNTLWGGVAGEDGINKLNYNEDGDGKIFAEIQKHLKKIKEKGIKRMLMGLKIEAKSINLTKWLPIYDEKNNHIGELRSGAFSPKFNKAVGISMINKDYCNAGQKVKLKLDNQLVTCEVCKFPIK